MLRLKSMRQYWASKLKEIALDYKSSFAGTLEAAKLRPIRTVFYTGCTITGYVAYKSTPSEAKYIAALVESSNEMLLCGGERSQHTDEYLQSILKFWAKGMLRYKHLGFCSVMYSSEHSKDTKSYKAISKYANPRWLDFKDQLIDVGVFGRWWKLNYTMTDYDVDFAQFPKEYTNILEKFYDILRTALGYSYFSNLQGQPKRTILYVDCNEVCE